MKIHAFQGYRYTAEVGDAGLLAAPPFDQIDPKLRDELHARSPHHYSRFTKPVGASSGDAAPSDDEAPPGDRYTAAAAVHERWLEEGIVARDDEPALYPYVIASPSGERRTSLLALVEVGTTEASDLRPHELTVDKPLADRLALLRTTRIDPEPVMLLADDNGGLDVLLERDTDGREPLVEHRDADGNRHLLYRLSDREAIGGYQRLLAEEAATIADGHHRCRTAQLYAAEIGAAPGTAPASKMAVLISVASRSLAIDPIHRALGSRLDAAALEPLTLSRTPFPGATGAELAASVAAAADPALGVWLRPGRPEIWRIDASRAPASTPAKARDLSAVLLHHLLLPAVGLGIESSTDGTIAYRSSPDHLYSMLDSGEAESGFWLPPMDPTKFAEAVSDGDVLPPKSTRFMPKLISGLVWAGHDTEIF